MRSLKRLDKPQRLVVYGEKWTTAFLASGKDRPSSGKYGHLEIKEELAKISFQKCFYSEVKFPDITEAQVDHYVEVAEDPALAFEWENLYLSHKSSNFGKSSNAVIPNSTCLDPFTNTDDEIEQHLDFEDETILGLNKVGINTIQKYNLNKPIYNILRSKELRNVDRIIREAYVQEVPIEDIKNILRQFANLDRPFSLMFKKMLIKNDFW